MNDQQKSDQWAVIDLFGHTRIAGRISEHTLGGETFVRVDVPRGDGLFTTELYGAKAIYSIKFVDETIARESSRRLDSVPVSAYGMAEVIRKLESPAPEPEDDDDRF